MMDLERAMNMRVNGKEVKRLKIGGVVVWEKNVPATINLISDKTSVSEGEEVCLTATVYDKFGRVCPDRTVEFINTSTDELISAVTTDENGECNVYYTVEGTESLYIQCKYGIILSEIYVKVLNYEDILFDINNWDKGPVGSKISAPTNKQFIVPAVRSGVMNKEFTKSTHYSFEFDWQPDSSGYTQRSRVIFFRKIGSGDFWGDNTIEVGGDVTSNGFFGIQITYHNEDRTRTQIYPVKNISTSGNAWYHVKIVRNDKTVEVYINGKLYYTHTFITELYNTLAIWKWQYGTSTLKNFVLTELD